MPPSIASRNSAFIGKLLLGTGGIDNTRTVASAASATLNAFSIAGSTITVTGTTNITTATGFNVTNVATPTITDTQAVTITNSATFAIQGAPAAGGSVTITNAYAFWVVAGAARFGGNITIDDAKNVILNTTTGTKIGTATAQKLGFWNATPVIQPATTGTTQQTTAGVGTAIKTDSTSTGGVGATAYSVSDMVANLKNAGILAA